MFHSSDQQLGEDEVDEFLYHEIEEKQKRPDVQNRYMPSIVPYDTVCKSIQDRLDDAEAVRSILYETGSIHERFLCLVHSAFQNQYHKTVQVLLHETATYDEDGSLVRLLIRQPQEQPINRQMCIDALWRSLHRYPQYVLPVYQEVALELIAKNDLKGLELLIEVFGIEPSFSNNEGLELAYRRQYDDIVMYLLSFPSVWKATIPQGCIQRYPLSILVYWSRSDVETIYLCLSSTSSSSSTPCVVSNLLQLLHSIIGFSDESVVLLIMDYLIGWPQRSVFNPMTDVR